jgi:hypothetical protein
MKAGPVQTSKYSHHYPVHLFGAVLEVDVESEECIKDGGKQRKERAERRT